MKYVLGGLAAGFGAYYLLKWAASRPPIGGDITPSGEHLYMGGMGHLGDEAGVYGYLYRLRDGLQKATESYSKAVKKINDLDLDLNGANVEFIAADESRRPTVLFRIAEIQRQRDQAVLEAELIIRNVINPLRYQLITEEARLKSAVIAPKIALNRSGVIPAF